MLKFWLIERFPSPTNEELRTMLPVLAPLEQARVYQTELESVTRAKRVDRRLAAASRPRASRRV